MSTFFGIWKNIFAHGYTGLHRCRIKYFQNKFYFKTSYDINVFFLRKNHGWMAEIGFCKLTTSLEALKVNESRGLDSGKGMLQLSPLNAAIVNFQCLVKITPSNFFSLTACVSSFSVQPSHSQLHFQNIMFLGVLKSGCRQPRTEEPTAGVTSDFISILSGNHPTIKGGQNDLLSAEECNKNKLISNYKITVYFRTEHWSKSLEEISSVIRTGFR